MKDNGWGKEPFDLRLTVLRMIRNLPGILLITIVITVVLSGAYYLRNVTFRHRTYAATATFCVEYADEDWIDREKYINAYTWNLWMTFDEFQTLVKQRYAGSRQLPEKLDSLLTANMYSDLRMVSITCTSDDQAFANELCSAACLAMTEDFKNSVKDIAAIRVVDLEEAAENLNTVKPVRATVLAAVIGLFTGVIFFLLKEILFEKIWLPEALTNRYGFPNAGIPGTELFWKNLEHFFAGKKSIAICPVSQELDPEEIARGLRARKEWKDVQWISVPCPELAPEAADRLREAEGVLLLVPGGFDVKRMALMTDFLEEQGVVITAATLWDEDAWLLRWYYLWNYRK